MKSIVKKFFAKNRNTKGLLKDKIQYLVHNDRIDARK
ncbi:Uncharacterised protein [Legionella beliardensis]|uniref:Uncharacterized protein n=1 Tax=Legionella beliardensis TaxID=91822 RepID=A0A378I0T6_9GAMM|nr:Uncharacterised protein [Legionella beliardensis]